MKQRHKYKTNHILLSQLALFKKWLLIGLVSIGIVGCSKPVFKSNYESRYSEDSIDQHMQHHTIGFNDYQLHYVSIGEHSATPVVMIHGTPGGWDTFKYVLGNTLLQEQFQLASIDRLGWAQSSLSEASPELLQAELSYQQQAKAIAAIIEQFSPKKKVILLGHSLGASIAPRVALDRPDLIAGLMLISGTLNPELGGPRWYNRAAGIWPVSRMVSERMLRSNDEIMVLQRELNALFPVWSQLVVPTTVIQGTKDRLVSPKNAAFAREQLKHLGENLEIVELEKVGHFIPWEQGHIIERELLLLKEKINPVAKETIGVEQ